MEDLRCDGCDIGILRESLIEVRAYKLKAGERSKLYSCQNCGRCYVMTRDHEISRLYDEFVDYRTFDFILRHAPEFTRRDAEKYFLTTYGTGTAFTLKAWLAAYEEYIVKRSRKGSKKKNNPSQNSLF